MNFRFRGNDELLESPRVDICDCWHLQNGLLRYLSSFAKRREGLFGCTRRAGIYF